RDDVVRATNAVQRPYVSASITGTPFFLVGGNQVQASTSTSGAAGPVPSARDRAPDTDLLACTTDQTIEHVETADTINVASVVHDVFDLTEVRRNVVTLYAQRPDGTWERWITDARAEGDRVVVGGAFTNVLDSSVHADIRYEIVRASGAISGRNSI